MVRSQKHIIIYYKNKNKVYLTLTDVLFTDNFQVHYFDYKKKHNIFLKLIKVTNIKFLQYFSK